MRPIRRANWLACVLSGAYLAPIRLPHCQELSTYRPQIAHCKQLREPCRVLGQAQVTHLGAITGLKLLQFLRQSPAPVTHVQRAAFARDHSDLPVHCQVLDIFRLDTNCSQRRQIRPSHSLEAAPLLESHHGRWPPRQRRCAPVQTMRPRQCEHSMPK